jgi:hypothetical protein
MIELAHSVIHSPASMGGSAMPAVAAILYCLSSASSAVGAALQA